MGGHSNAYQSSDDEDPSLAADILRQFTAANTNQKSEQGLKASKQIIQIIPPTIDNKEDYNFLPGYLKVEEVLGTVNVSYPAKYSIRLANGDIVNVRNLLPIAFFC